MEKMADHFFKYREFSIPFEILFSIKLEANFGDTLPKLLLSKA
jgi:hypothetical protein